MDLFDELFNPLGLYEGAWWFGEDAIIDNSPKNNKKQFYE